MILVLAMTANRNRLSDQNKRTYPEQRYQQEENRCYKVLTDYFHSLRAWKQQYAPKQPGDEWHPLFVEALQRESYIEYLLDILLYGPPEESSGCRAKKRGDET